MDIQEKRKKRIERLCDISLFFSTLALIFSCVAFLIWAQWLWF